MSIDEEREGQEPETKKRRVTARDTLRREGYKLLLKPIKRYNVGTEFQRQKANIDVDLTVDAMSADLDYYLLVTGDGDFTRLVEALQARGKRVDLLSFDNVSGELKRAVDYAFNGYLMPGILPPPTEDVEQKTGFLHMVNEEKGFGFISTYVGLNPADLRENIFVHISAARDERGIQLSNSAFASLRTRQAILQFDIDETDAAKPQARNVQEMR
jgi:uncharacterized LabA/DUF88 family protein